MKILYYGGQKSGKSRLAERKALRLASDTKPYYIATYDNSYGDEEMCRRISRHQAQREARFITIEEPKDLNRVVKEGHTCLIDCMSMWILNTLEADEETLLAEVEALCAKGANIIFVLNDVGSGVIPIEASSRKYVDRSGIIGQKLAECCDEVYEVTLGLGKRLK